MTVLSNSCNFAGNLSIFLSKNDFFYTTGFSGNAALARGKKIAIVRDRGVWYYIKFL